MTKPTPLANLNWYLRHGATCTLQAVRDNHPADALCTCGLREAYNADAAERAATKALRTAARAVVDVADVPVELSDRLDALRAALGQQEPGR